MTTGTRHHPFMVGTSGCLMRMAGCGVAIWLMMASLVLAQSAGPGVVSGVVVDSTGGVVPGADVELTPASTPGNGVVAVRHVMTDGTGNFRFDQLPPGRYTVRALLEGFEPVTLDLSVGSRATPALRLRMTVAGIQQETTVTSSPLQADTSANRNLNAIVADQSALEDLPVFDQDYLGTLSRFLDAGAVGGNGVSLVVDGLEANSIGVSASAIQQIKINQDPYSAEFSRPGRGRIEVVTKAGTDAFHGTANVMVRDAALNARDAFATSKAPDRRRLYEGYLSGPVGDGKRSSFVLSASRNEQDSFVFIHAIGLDGLIQGQVANPSRRTDLSGSISYQRTNKTTMTFRVSSESAHQTGARVGGVTLSEGAVDIDSGETQFVYSMQTILSRGLLHQTRVMYGQEFDDIVGLSSAPRIVVQDAFTGGGAQQDLLRTEQHATLTDVFTWSPSRHTVKFGVNVPDWSRRGFNDRTNSAGTFYFANLAQYQAGLPYAFAQQRGDGRQVFLGKVLGAFAQDEFQIHPRLTIAAGVRYDWQNYFHDNNNVAPRASIAWAPRGLARTIVRGGAGLFYDRSGPIVISDLLSSRAGLLRRYLVVDPDYPAPLRPGDSLDAQPSTIAQLSQDAHIPSTLQFSAGIERQIGKATAVSVTYTGMHGYDLFYSLDVNAPAPPLFDARPDPELAVVRQIESAGRLVSHSLQIMLRGSVTRVFNGQMQYTLGRAMNDTNGAAWFPANDYDLRGEWARTDFDRRHGFEGLGTFKLGAAIRAGVALSLSSGRPYTLLAGEDLYRNGRGSARPPGVPRNSLAGPGYANLDLRVSREFVVHPRSKPSDPWSLTFGVDAFNVLNRTNFTSYIGTVNSPLFGRATAALPRRRLQFSVRTKF